MPQLWNTVANYTPGSGKQPQAFRASRRQPIRLAIKGDLRSAAGAQDTLREASKVPDDNAAADVIERAAALFSSDLRADYDWLRARRLARSLPMPCLTR